MANADGSVIIKADIDDKQAQKELNALEKKIEALQEKLTNKKSARDTLFNQANNLGAQLDQAKAKLARRRVLHQRRYQAAGGRCSVYGKRMELHE